MHHERIQYLNAVCDSIKDHFRKNSPDVAARFQLALMSPLMKTFPAAITQNFLYENGVPAGVVFGISYFALTRKVVHRQMLLQIMLYLNQFQMELMHESLRRVQKKFYLS